MTLVLVDLFVDVTMTGLPPVTVYYLAPELCDEEVRRSISALLGRLYLRS